jgi:ABC-2 type transport system ATP-binding protein
MASPSPIAIEVMALERSFEDITAVKSVSFQVPAGTLYSLLGPNGAGKTTTINMLSCNLTPNAGDASILGHSITHQPDEVRKYIGICPQGNVLYEHLTVYENLIFFGKMYEVPKSTLEERADYLIKRVGLLEKRNSVVEKLSGGQKRRVNLLAGLIHDPDVVFLDEPTAGLDPQTRRMLWDYIEELKKKNKTIILTTHYMDEADILSDQVGIMDHGEIIAQGTPADLKESIGKGDNLIFRVDGSASNIDAVLKKLVDSKEIFSGVPMEGDIKGIRITSLDGIGKIGSLVNEFIENKIKVEDISIQANSLENVFLELTGRSLRE